MGIHCTESYWEGIRTVRKVSRAGGGGIVVRTKQRTVRDIIDGYADKGPYDIFPLGDSFTFIYPSRKGDGGFYLVSWCFPPKRAAFWVCSCRGFRFHPSDRCPHITDLSTAMEEALGKMMDEIETPRRAIAEEILSHRKSRSKSSKGSVKGRKDELLQEKGSRSRKGATKKSRRSGARSR